MLRAAFGPALPSSRPVSSTTNLAIDTPGYDPVSLLVDFELEGRAEWPADHIAIAQGIDGKLVIRSTRTPMLIGHRRA